METLERRLGVESSKVRTGQEETRGRHVLRGEALVRRRQVQGLETRRLHLDFRILEKSPFEFLDYTQIGRTRAFHNAFPSERIGLRPAYDTAPLWLEAKSVQKRVWVNFACHG